MADEAVRADGLSVRLGSMQVLQGVSFRAHYGEMTSVLGPNGAGKSTLLKALAGLLPYQGRLRIGGQGGDSLPREERVRLLSYVPQVSLLASPFRVEHVVRQGRYALRASRTTHKTAVEQAMSRVDVAHLRKRPFTQLSGGERRRVLLARALATEAKIILLDEPTDSLDIGHTLSLYALLRTLAESGYCILVVLHRLDEAARFTDHAILLNEGRLTHQGATADVISAAPVREVYQVEVDEAPSLVFRLPT